MAEERIKIGMKNVWRSSRGRAEDEDQDSASLIPKLANGPANDFWAVRPEGGSKARFVLDPKTTTRVKNQCTQIVIIIQLSKKKCGFQKVIFF